MKITLKYYGEISEILDKKEETISLSTIVSLYDLKKQFLAKSVKLNSIAINIAVNNELIDQDVFLKNKDVISFLPPFAGG
ncbi:MoaD/ThiS family protein [Flavobacteriales bacterium]|nr:MoaD/ThiS family protein [Flavobacteriales bacterium]